MLGRKRSLVIIWSTIGFALAGLALGVMAQVASMIPDLAGGGHATGGKHFNFMILGTLVGAALGFLIGLWRWRAMGKRVD